MTVSEMIIESHKNSVEKGWWLERRPIGELIALINSEFSEALEEYRANRPMVWYVCRDVATTGVCCRPDYDNECNVDESSCEQKDSKPEGIAVELIDGMIRIFDLLGAMGYECSGMNRQGGIKEEVMMLRRFDNMRETYGAMDLPVLVGLLQKTVCECVTSGNAYESNDYQRHIEPLDLMRAVTMLVIWLLARDVDPDVVYIAKHEYNKTRPYRHGGKKA